METIVAYAPKLLSGIDVIDQSWGGLYRGGSYLIYGRAATGRGLLTLMFTHTGVMLEERCLFISPDRPKDLMIQSASIGFNLRKAHESGLVRLLRIPPMLNLEEIGDEGVAKAINDLVSIIRQNRPNRLVINDFMPFAQFRSFERFRAAFIQMLEQIDSLDTTVMLVMAEPANQQSRRVIEFMSNQMTGSVHIEMVEDDASSTQRRLTLIPNIGHIKRRVVDYWDLEHVVARAEEPVSSSLRMLPDPSARTAPADVQPYAHRQPPTPREATPEPPPAPAFERPQEPEYERYERPPYQQDVPSAPAYEAPPPPSSYEAPRQPYAPPPEPPQPDPTVRPIPLGRPAPAPPPMPQPGVTAATTSAAPPPHVYSEPPAPEPLPPAPTYEPPVHPTYEPTPYREVPRMPEPPMPEPPRQETPAQAPSEERTYFNLEAPAEQPGPAAHEAPAREETPARKEAPVLTNRETFRNRLQQQFLRRDVNETPFLLIAMRMDRGAERSARPFDFEFILDLVNELLREQDALLVDQAQERLIVLLGESRSEEAQRFFARLKNRLREEAPQQADHLLHSVSAIVVPDGRPFQNAEEFLTYALDEA